MAAMQIKNIAARAAALAAEMYPTPGLEALHKDPDVREVRGPSGKVYAGTLGCCLPVNREPRRSAIYLVEAKAFDPVILLTILINCSTMAWQSPLDPPGTPKAAVLDVLEWVFLAIFTAEMLCKITAYSFVWHKEAYLRDPWCQLDFVVVTLAWLPILFPSMGNYSVLRAFRALRPLRALKRVPGMPVLVQWILNVLPKMGNVLMLSGFVFLIFGIVGMELFKGALHYRCARPGFEERSGLSLADQAAFDTGLSCNLERRDQCAEGMRCAYFDENPDSGMVSFDSVAGVFISYIQAITFDDWATVMYDLMAAFAPFVWVYFILIVMVAGFFVINLFLAVIFIEYDETQKQMKAEERARTQRTMRTQRSDTKRSDGSEDADAPVETHALLGAGALPPDGKLSDGQAREPAAAPARVDTPTGLWNVFVDAANSTWLGNTSTGLVLLNLLLMCLPYEGMSEAYDARLEGAASVISWLFIIEMAIKLLGLGCADYWSDGWNVLDGSIVSMSIVEMVVSALAAASGGVNLSFMRILRLLRMLRVLRILRLMRSWRGLYKIIMTFIRAIPQMSNIVILILLTMFMFSLLGMQLFGGMYNPQTGYAVEPCPGGVCEGGLEEKPHYHFDYCGPAMISVFILLTGEWIDAMGPAVDITGMVSSLFFIFVVLLGKYLLMNLLVAVILTEFAEEDEAGGAPSTRRASLSTTRETAREADGTEAADAPPPPQQQPAWPEDHSLYLFGPHNPVRSVCKWAIRQPWFDQIVIAAIVVSSVCLAIDSPRLDPETDLAHALKRMDLFFTALFFCEMMSKVIAHGLVLLKGAYLHSAWNQVDFVIVMISLVVLLADSVPQLRPLRVLRVMRVLRPLRLISRNAGMKLIITSLFKAMPAVTNVFGVVFALQLVFAILGMQLFSGTFGSCNNPAILTREACIDDSGGGAGRALKGGGVAVWDGESPLVWANPEYGSFDNFGDAMLLLYIMSSGDQWELPMWDMMGATESGQASQRNDFSAASIYAIAWMFTSYIFAINLFVGVVVDNFSRMQKEEDGSATMTKDQQQWASTMKALASALPQKAKRPPEDDLRRLIYKLVNSTRFDGFITFVIIANIGVMACDFYNIEADARLFAYYNGAIQLFCYIYYVEAVLKLIALGCDGYFADSWCRFDFFLVCTSLLDQFASELLDAILPLPPMLLRVLRVLRILRILRLLKGAKDLRDLIVTMVLSFPSLLNVGSLLALVLFIYAVLGVNMFTFVNHGEVGSTEGGGLTPSRNFDTFSAAFLVLFQCLTGDGWSSIMAAAMIDEASGRCTAAAGDCGSAAAIPYFISFQVIGSFVFLNLVVAVILENFAALQNISTELVSPSDLEMFSEAWSTFDPDATNLMPVSDVPKLLLMVPPPLGVRGQMARKAHTLCLMLKCPQYDGKVAYSELLKELIENNYNKSGADLDEFKEVAPGVYMPPIGLPGGATKPAEQAPTEMSQVFGMQAFARPEAQDALKGMAARARMRVAQKGSSLARPFRRVFGAADLPAPEVALPKLIRDAHDAAKTQLVVAKAERDRHLEALQKEFKEKTTLAPDGALSCMRRWQSTIEQDDAHIKEMESTISRAECMRSLAATANQKQRLAAERRADAQQQAQALRLAEQRARETAQLANEAEEEAAGVQAELIKMETIKAVNALYHELPGGSPAVLQRLAAVQPMETERVDTETASLATVSVEDGHARRLLFSRSRTKRRPAQV